MFFFVLFHLPSQQNRKLYTYIIINFVFLLSKRFWFILSLPRRGWRGPAISVIDLSQTQ